MKIKRIKLTNFIGIWHGLGETEIEINFDDSKVVMISGANGSGKSVLMSQLHPYKDSFDDRKTLTLEGKEGKKEITIEHNNSTYEITHLYGNSSQSFIKKDGIELNENGGVRTCEDIIGKELGITKEYFKIGKIGSNTKNFVDFPAAERKNYIGNFLNIEEMTDAYSTVRTKFTNLKKNIQSIADELKHFEEKEILLEKTNQLEKVLENTEKKLTSSFQLQGSLTQDLNNKRTEAAKIDYFQVENDLKKLTLEKTENEKIINGFSGSKEKDVVEKILETLTKDINQLNISINVNETKKIHSESLIADFKNKIEKDNLELKSLGTESDLTRIKNELTEIRDTEKELKSQILANKYGKLINEIKKSGKSPESFLEKFKAFTNFIEENFTILRDNSINDNEVNIEVFLRDDIISIINAGKGSLKTTIDKKKELLKSKESLKNKKEGFIDQLANLEKRPKDCSIDDCPFIKEALEHKNVLAEIEGIKNEISIIEKEIEKFELKFSNLLEIENVFKLFENQYRNVNPRENAILTEFLNIKSLPDFIADGLADFTVARQDFYTECFNAIDLIEKFLANHSKLKSLENTEQVLSVSDSSVKEKFEKSISENNKLLEDENKNLATILENLKNNKEELEKKNIEKIYNESYLKAVNSMAELDKNILELTQSKIKFTKLNTEINEINTNLNNVNLSIATDNNLKSQTQNEINENKVKIGQITLLKEKLETLNNEFMPTELIMNALSPTSGIPLILIQLYLEKTESIANELLKIAFNGDFEIEFSAEAKEFFIKVRTKDNVKGDIKLASQGEISLTTLSISLALIEQSIGEYNILCLDEIDGPLDPTNRENFISILTKQIEKLDIEQVFIISHNDAFDLCEMGLILLRDSAIDPNNSEFMKNKKIIFNYNK